MRSVSLYFVSCLEAGAWKIGISFDVAARFRSLQSMNPLELTPLADRVVSTAFSRRCPGYLDALAIEKTWHEAFAGDRLRGEWFYRTGRLAEALIAFTNDGTLPGEARLRSVVPSRYKKAVQPSLGTCRGLPRCPNDAIPGASTCSACHQYAIAADIAALGGC